MERGSTLSFSLPTHPQPPTGARDSELAPTQPRHREVTWTRASEDIPRPRRGERHAPQPQGGKHPSTSSGRRLGRTERGSPTSIFVRDPSHGSPTTSATPRARGRVGPTPPGTISVPNRTRTSDWRSLPPSTAAEPGVFLPCCRWTDSASPGLKIAPSDTFLPG